MIPLENIYFPSHMSYVCKLYVTALKKKKKNMYKQTHIMFSVICLFQVTFSSGKFLSRTLVVLA